jgi:hypothetical protein
VELFGVTSRNQAFREGLYQAASNRYRRKLIRFTTEMEGFIPALGDLVAVQHDMVAWGQHAEATAVATVTNRLTYSEQIGGTNWYVTNATITANNTTAPDGAVTADRIVGNATDSYVGYIVTGAGASQTWTASVWLRADSATQVQLYVGDGGGGSGATGVTCDLTAQWQRFSVTRTTSAGTTTVFLQIGGGSSLTTGETIYAWGAQLEQAASARGYVRTVASQRTATVIDTTDALTFTAGATHYVGLRTKAGAIEGPLVATWAGTKAIAVDGVTGTVYTGTDYERTHIAFGAGETWRQPAKVIAIRPRGLEQVEIECINEDPSVHTAENGQTAPAIVTSQLTTLYTAPTIANLTCVSSPSDTARALMTWTPAPGAEVYQIEAANTFNPSATNVSWTRLGDTTASSYSVTALYGAATSFRVRGVGLAAGPWYGVQFGDTADYMWTNPAALMWDRDGDGDVDATDNAAIFWN